MAGSSHEENGCKDSQARITQLEQEIETLTKMVLLMGLHIVFYLAHPIQTFDVFFPKTRPSYETFVPFNDH
jgi:hypothetical protein